MNKGFRGEGLKGHGATEVFLNILHLRGLAKTFQPVGPVNPLPPGRTGLHPEGILATVMGSIHTVRLTLLCEHALSLWSYRQVFGADL